MRSLLLSSLFFIILSSCFPRLYQNLTPSCSGPNELKPIFNTPQSSYLYKAKIDVYGHYLSGLLFIKPTAKDTFRVVFTSELGLKFFDFGLFPSGMTVHYCMEKLNRKIVLKTLEKDMKMILMNDLDKKEAKGKLQQDSSENVIFKFKDHKDFYYYFLNIEGQIIRIENTSKSKIKTEVELKDYKGKVPYFVNIKHITFKLNIELNYLER